MITALCIFVEDNNTIVKKLKINDCNFWQNMPEKQISELLNQYKPKSRLCQRHVNKRWKATVLILVTGTGQHHL
jgi:hypothetical protein